MVITIPKQLLINLIKQEIAAWGPIGGGANPDGYDFDPEKTDPAHLKQLGYYDNVDAWVAGARIKALQQWLLEVDSMQ